jgi:sulfur dioxygenase
MPREITFRQLNPHACRSYLLAASGSKDVVLFDPVLEHVPAYLELLDKEKLRLTHVIDTHTHADHIAGGAALKDQTGCEYIMHTTAPAHCVSFFVADGQRLELAGVPVEFLHTPGHTRDSICVVLPDRILTGDTLFLDEGGAGRDDLPGGDPAAHWESLQRILTLPPELVVYPAHEYRDRSPSRLAEQKQRNPHLRPRTKAEFVQYLEDLKLGPADWMKDVLKANYACARDPKAAWIPVDVPACEIKGTLEHGVNDIQVAVMPVDELQRRIASGEGPVLLDVREADEWIGELGHLAGSRHIPVGELSRRLSALDDVKDREIVTVCRSGGRAHTAAQILEQAGFSRVRVLKGGMKAWNEADLQVERSH